MFVDDRYAICRVADDLIDDSKTASEARQHLDALSNYINAAYQPASSRKLSAALDQLPPAARPALSLLPSLDLPRHTFDALLSGFSTDVSFLEGRLPIETSEDLKVYAEAVASSVAEMCVLLAWSTYGYGEASTPELRQATIDAARQMGVALQYVNIARDVPADARMGRMYLPKVPLPVDNVHEALAGMTEARLGLIESAVRAYLLIMFLWV